MQVLITGGAGFIGSHLAELLLEYGYGVSVIDNLSTGAFANIKPLKNHVRFEYSIETIMNIPHLAEMVDEADVIYHLAAAVGVPRLVVALLCWGARHRRGPPTKVVAGCSARRCPQPADRRPRWHIPMLPDQHVLRRATNVHLCSQPALQRFL